MKAMRILVYLTIIITGVLINLHGLNVNIEYEHVIGWILITLGVINLGYELIFRKICLKKKKNT